MPNWCSNSLTVTGNKNFVTKLAEEMRNENFCNSVIPEPDWDKIPNGDGELPKLRSAPEPLVIKEFPNSGKQDTRWYDWRIENWGTKWEIADLYTLEVKDVSSEVSTLTVGFDSAWSPPMFVIEKLWESDLITDLEFLYYEGGLDCGGLFHNGDAIAFDDFSSARQLKDKNWQLIADEFGVEEWLDEMSREYADEPDEALA